MSGPNAHRANDDHGDDHDHNHHGKADQYGMRFVDKTGDWQERAQAVKSKGKPEDDNTDDQDEEKPAGGYDEAPLPRLPPGYTLRFTFHGSSNLPAADLNTLSSDPYLVATLSTDVPKRNKEEPDLQCRTPTIHHDRDPQWETEWIVANVPSSGFRMKCRLYDEDAADRDDRLGNVHVDVDHIDEHWKGFERRTYPVQKRMGSKRAYTLRGIKALFSHTKMNANLTVSVENLGRTQDNTGGRIYTVGPMAWSRHYSPLLGKLTGTKDPNETDEKDAKKTEKYNFQAIKMQLQGPVHEHMYHRYVEFKPFVAGMFTDHSLRGRILNHVLHHQHARIYNYNKSTLYGVFPKPSPELTRQFLDFVHYDQGGRIFTYVITLDTQWRFTETGKEFGIDMLSKHTMHSNVAQYVAFSGEFFIRRLKHPHTDKERSPDPQTETMPPAPEPDEEGKVEEASGHRRSMQEPSKDTSLYELIIDNDSGTYRPNAKYLLALKELMERNLPELQVKTLDCQADEEEMTKLKDEQRERKKGSGKQMTYMQNRSDSSLSSSDEEELDRRAHGEHSHQSKFGKVKTMAGMMTHRLPGVDNGGAEHQGGFVARPKAIDSDDVKEGDVTKPGPGEARPRPDTLLNHKQDGGVASETALDEDGQKQKDGGVAGEKRTPHDDQPVANDGQNQQQKGGAMDEGAPQHKDMPTSSNNDQQQGLSAHYATTKLATT